MTGLLPSPLFRFLPARKFFISPREETHLWPNPSPVRPSARRRAKNAPSSSRRRLDRVFSLLFRWSQLGARHDLERILGTPV